MRKDVYLVSKCNKYSNAQDEGALGGHFESHLNASLERLRTDHVDCYYIHGIQRQEGRPGPGIDMLRDPGVKAAFEALKKAGKIRFAGLSCHDARLPEILEVAAEVGWIDQVMIKFNFRDVGGKDRYDDLNRAIDKASKANIGLVAMKTQSGAAPFPATKKELEEKGVKIKNLHPTEKRVVEMLEKDFKREVAAIKTVWMDGRMQVVVSEMTNRDRPRERRRQPSRSPRRRPGSWKSTARRPHTSIATAAATSARPPPRASPSPPCSAIYRYYEAYGKREQASALTRRSPPPPATRRRRPPRRRGRLPVRPPRRRPRPPGRPAALLSRCRPDTARRPS